MKHLDKHGSLYKTLGLTMGANIIAVVAVLMWFGWSVANIAAVPSVIASDKVNSARWLVHLEAMRIEREQTTTLIALVVKMDNSMDSLIQEIRIRNAVEDSRVR